MENTKSIKQILNEHKGWLYLLQPDDNTVLSGWKLHVYGTDINDSEKIIQALLPIVVNRKDPVPMKIATQMNYDYGIGKPGDPQYGKAATIYLTPFLFKDARRLKTFMITLDEALEVMDYKKKGEIHGDKSINGTLHYRYEFSYIVDPREGLGMDHYPGAYHRNRGEFNIKDNPDIFDLITI